MSETLGLAPKRDVLIPTVRCQLQESVRNFWVATVESHILREDLMTPGFWANVSYQFKQFDRIEVRQDDGKFWAEYLILSADKTSAYLKELRWYDLTGVPQKDNADFEYKYRGPYAMHSIVKTKDGTVMVEKLPTKVAAEKWLADYMERI